MRPSANSMFRIATEFTEINDLDREIINTTVEAILKREAKKRVYSEKQKNILKRRKKMRRSTKYTIILVLLSFAITGVLQGIRSSEKAQNTHHLIAQEISSSVLEEKPTSGFGNKSLLRYGKGYLT